MVEVGLLYVKGSIPTYEEFGNLPTTLVRRGEDLRRVDLLIIPPGNIVESKGVNGELGEAIVEFAEDGGLILGICSGLQILSEYVDTGVRRVEGLGLLRVRASRLIGLDWAEVKVTGKTWLTKGLTGETVKGLHIHTYGRLEGEDRHFLESRLPRHNYFSGPVTIPSGFVNREGNVIGALPHKLLDVNPVLRDNVLSELGVTDESLIIERNRELRKALSSELGVDTGIKAFEGGAGVNECVKLAVVSGETGEGKTFVTAGLAGAARLKGLRVRVAKLGSDLRDLHPSLYLIKEGVRGCEALMIKGFNDVFGWVKWFEGVKELCRDADLLIIEGVMGVLTGSCRECGCLTPCSTLEFLKCSGIPALLITSCRNGGVEDAVFRASKYLGLLRGEGVRVAGVVINEFYGGKEELRYVRNALKGLGVKVYVIGKASMPAHSIPEVDLDLHRYSLEALKLVSRSVSIDELINELTRHELNNSYLKG